VTVSMISQRALHLARAAANRLYGIWCWAVLATLLAPLWLIGVLLPRPALLRPLTKGVARTLLALMGLDVSASGLERLPREPHALVVNHTSFLDAVVLLAFLPADPRTHFVAKREYAGPWWIRRLFEAEGVVFVERQETRQLAEDAEALVALLARGDSVILFPEGLLDRATGLRPFRSGVFLAAAKTGVPVATAGLRGLRTVLRDGVWWPRRAPVELELGAVLRAEGSDWAAAAKLRDAARAQVLRLCGEPDLGSLPQP